MPLYESPNKIIHVIQVIHAGAGDVGANGSGVEVGLMVKR